MTADHIFAILIAAQILATRQQLREDLADEDAYMHTPAARLCRDCLAERAHIDAGRAHPIRWKLRQLAHATRWPLVWTLKLCEKAHMIEPHAHEHCALAP